MIHEERELLLISKGSGPYWSHMHINDGILYLRHGEYFAAYKIK